MENRRPSTLGPDCAQSGDRGFPDERVVRPAGEVDEPFDDLAARRLVFARCPCRHLHHGRVGVVEQRQQVDPGVRSGDLSGAASYGSTGILECRGQHLIGQLTEPLERTQCGGTNRRLVRVERTSSGVDVTGVTGERHLPARRPGGHSFSRPVSVTTMYASAKATTVASSTPMTMAIPELATIAQIRRIGPDRLLSGTVVSAMPTGTHGRRMIGALRGVRGVALAFLRQPARTSATMASATIHPA